MSWHNMTSEQAITLWSHYGWQMPVYRALCDVALCHDVPVDRRLNALATLNYFTQAKVLPVMSDEPVPDFTCRVLLGMTYPQPLRGWWARRRGRRIAADMVRRLESARSVLLTIESFMDEAKNEVSFAKKSIPEKLLS